MTSHLLRHIELKMDNNTYGKDVEKLESSRIANGSVKWDGCFEKQSGSLAGVAQWFERQPVNQRVTGSIPSQNNPVRARVAGQTPGRGHARGNHTLMFLSLSFSIKSIFY